MKIYNILIIFASLFYPKAKLWIKGRKKIFNHISSSLANDFSNRIWFHCASLGEFEQARPMIEAFKHNFPKYKIILTFFSPSGYEVVKENNLVDWSFYLPLDTPRNARKLINLFNPKLVIFVKYDFWYFILRQLSREKIPVLLISASFRTNQLFFKPVVGKWYKKLLFMFSHIFVQDRISKQLLEKINIKNVTIAGDTRFDRVVRIAETNYTHPLIEKFINRQKVIIAGSTYDHDNHILADFICCRKDIKLIVAPHETDSASINSTVAMYDNYIKLSVLEQSQKINTQINVLIIDTIGILSKIYRYATITYVGGGFGSGIHNILEAVVYGKPVFFGPNYHKFREAEELIEQKVAFCIKNLEEFTNKALYLLNNPNALHQIQKKAYTYINQHTGATEKIINWIKNNLVFEKS